MYESFLLDPRARSPLKLDPCDDVHLYDVLKWEKNKKAQKVWNYLLYPSLIVSNHPNWTRIQDNFSCEVIEFPDDSLTKLTDRFVTREVFIRITRKSIFIGMGFQRIGKFGIFHLFFQTAYSKFLQFSQPMDWAVKSTDAPWHQYETDSFFDLPVDDMTQWKLLDLEVIEVSDIIINLNLDLFMILVDEPEEENTKEYHIVY